MGNYKGAVFSLTSFLAAAVFCFKKLLGVIDSLNKMVITLKRILQKAHGAKFSANSNAFLK
ncbi:MAG: hypothetical protein ACJAS9_000376 [Polaribacter sp.]